MNLKHPTYARIIEQVQKSEIYNYRTLAIAVGVGYASIMERTQALEERGRLTRTQSGMFVAITPIEEPKSGVFERPPVISVAERNRQRIAQLQAAAAERRARQLNKTPYRPRRAPVLEAVIEQSETVLRDAPPDDPELGRLIIETPSATELKAAKRAAEIAAGHARKAAAEAERQARLEAKRLAKEKARAERAFEVAARREERARLAAIRRDEREAQRLARRASAGPCKYCKDCMGIGERRPPEGCPGCGKKFEREVIEFSCFGESSLAMFDGQ